MNYLNTGLKKHLIEKGASIVGFADLKDIPEYQRENYRYGISIAVSLNPHIIAKIKNELLDDLDRYAAKIIRQHGFNALPKIKENIQTDKTTLKTIFPHKTVATRSGIGWIGKCISICPWTQKYLKSNS